jgi:ABC-type multidrug transport system ATPase subunit
VSIQPVLSRARLSVARPSRHAEPGSETVVQVEGITKRWEKRPPLFADVDLAFPSGASIALIGPNGAGKTTFLRLLAGMIDPDAGTVTIDGLHPRRDRRAFARRIGFLSAGNGGLYARLTVARQLDLWGRLSLLEPQVRAAAIEASLARFELHELAGRRVDRISMGQRQRVRLALAFLHGPRVVLLDEPWNSLDDRGSTLLGDAIAEFTRGGGVVVCCTPVGTPLHDSADEIYTIGEGVIRRL